MRSRELVYNCEVVCTPLTCCSDRISEPRPRSARNGKAFRLRKTIERLASGTVDNRAKYNICCSSIQIIRSQCTNNQIIDSVSIYVSSSTHRQAQVVLSGQPIYLETPGRSQVNQI